MDGFTITLKCPTDGVDGGGTQIPLRLDTLCVIQGAVNKAYNQLKREIRVLVQHISITVHGSAGREVTVAFKLEGKLYTLPHPWKAVAEATIHCDPDELVSEGWVIQRISSSLKACFTEQQELMKSSLRGFELLGEKI